MKDHILNCGEDMKTSLIIAVTYLDLHEVDLWQVYYTYNLSSCEIAQVTVLRRYWYKIFQIKSDLCKIQNLLILSRFLFYFHGKNKSTLYQTQSIYNNGCNFKFDQVKTGKNLI